jgi:peptidoglycan/LPS O-acetylase OafA/YrhL
VTAAAPAGSATRGYLGGLEGIRGIACIAVICAHCWTHWTPDTTPGGLAQSAALGLVIFFAMSGLLIYLPFVRDIARGERRVNVRRFALRRVARVFPAYLVIFLICDFLLRAVFVGNAVQTSREATDAGAGMITDPVTLLANLTLTHSLFPATVQTGINPSWSLTTELCFYALLPLLALPLIARAPAWSSQALRRALAPGLLLVVMGLIGRTVAEEWWRTTAGMTSLNAEFGANGIAVLTLSLAGVADNFGLGMSVAVLFVWAESGRLVWLTRRRLLVIAVPVTVLAIAATFYASAFHPWFTTAAAGVAAAATLLVVAESTARRASSPIVRLLEWPGFRHIGIVSLSTYLWHYPVIVLISRLDERGPVVGGDTWITLVWAPVLVSALSVGLGTLTYRLVEKPAMDWSTRRQG